MIIPLFLSLFLLLAGGGWASNQALLIGIDEYQSSAINALSGATGDAKSLAQTLKEVGTFKPEDVHLLTSDGAEKPSKANILATLGKLIQKIQPGETLFLSYSGHGVSMDGVSYLVTWDTDPRSPASIKETAVASGELKDVLSRLSDIADVSLVEVFDMCRNDPRGADRGVTVGQASFSKPLTKQQARDLVIVNDDSSAKDNELPKQTMTLFSCSTNERSWEDPNLGRGYFSYYMERGLRGCAADSTGAVRLHNLLSYMDESLPQAVQKAIHQKQSPNWMFNGSQMMNLVLAQPSEKEESCARSFPAPRQDKEYAPRIMVVIPEKLLGNPNNTAPVAESELSGLLKDAGMNVIKAPNLNDLRNSNELNRLIQNPTTDLVKEIGKSNNFDILVTGESNAERGDDQLDLRSAQGQVTLTAFYADTGEVLSTNPGEPQGGAGLTAEAAGRTAIKNALENISDDFITELKNGIAEHAGDLQLQISNISSMDQYNRLENAVNRMQGVEGIHPLQFDALDGVATIEVRYYYPLSDLANGLSKIKDPGLVITSTSGRTIQAQVKQETMISPSHTAVPVKPRSVPKSPAKRPTKKP
jgi:hypothetical protein